MYLFNNTFLFSRILNLSIDIFKCYINQAFTCQTVFPINYLRIFTENTLSEAVFFIFINSSTNKIYGTLFYNFTVSATHHNFTIFYNTILRHILSIAQQPITSYKSSRGVLECIEVFSSLLYYIYASKQTERIWNKQKYFIIKNSHIFLSWSVMQVGLPTSLGIFYMKDQWNNLMSHDLPNYWFKLTNYFRLG